MPDAPVQIPSADRPSHDFDVVFVDHLPEVAPALQQVDAEVVGVDVERADAHLYYRRAALIQVGIEGCCVLLDAVAIDGFPAVNEFFGPDRLMVLHALQNDLEPLAGRGIAADRVADTAVAASVLGLPTGLGPLLTKVLDVELEGDKSKFQRADWEERPLSPEMADYAAGDVVHLPRLWSSLLERLEDAGRTAWYEQELVATIEQAAEDRRDWTRVKGAGRMTGREKAILRELWQARERLAQAHDIAPNRLIHDDVLRSLSTDPPATEAQLVRRSQRRRAQLREHASVLMAAITAGQEVDPEAREAEGRRWSEGDRAAYDALRKRRAEIAEDLGLDAGVLCPSRPLWAAVAGQPEDGSELCELANLRPWQAEVLADPLWEAYLEAQSEHAETPQDSAGEPTAG